MAFTIQSERSGTQECDIIGEMRNLKRKGRWIAPMRRNVKEGFGSHERHSHRSVKEEKGVKSEIVSTLGVGLPFDYQTKRDSHGRQKMGTF